MMGRSGAALRLVACALVAAAVLALLRSASRGEGPRPAVRRARPQDGEPTPLAAYVRGDDTMRLCTRPLYRHRGFVVTALTNEGMLPMTLNWLVSLQRVGVDVRLPLLLCSDTASWTALAARGLTAFRLTDDVMREIGYKTLPAESRGVQQFRSHDYTRLAHTKLAVVAYLLTLGENVIFSDVDLVLLNGAPNAFDFVIDRLAAEPMLGMLIQNDEYQLCTGFYAVRSSLATRELFDTIVGSMASSPETETRHDQDFLNEELARRGDATQPLYAVLDSTQFRIGKNFFHDFYGITEREFPAEFNSNWTIRSAALPQVAHANWLVGTNKVDQLRKWRLWWADDARAVDKALGPAAPAAAAA